MLGQNQPYLLRLHAFSEDAEAQSLYFIVALQLIPRRFASGLNEVASVILARPVRAEAQPTQDFHNHTLFPLRVFADADLLQATLSLPCQPPPLSRLVSRSE